MFLTKSIIASQRIKISRKMSKEIGKAYVAGNILVQKNVSSADLMKEMEDKVLEEPVYAKLKRVKAKPRQLKLKQFMDRQKLNWQKYPLKHCVFSNTLNKEMYDPPKYRKEFCGVELANATFCENCGLRPCLAVGKELMILDSLKAAYQFPPLAIKNALEITLAYMDKTCGVLYAKRMQFSKSRVPYCLRATMAKKMDQAVAEVQEKVNENPQKGGKAIPEYLRNTECHHHSLKLALAEMSGKMTEEQVYQSAIKFETPFEWGTFEY